MTMTAQAATKEENRTRELPFSMYESALASLLTDFFLHKSFGMLNAPLRRLSQSHAPRKRGAPHAVPKTRMR